MAEPQVHASVPERNVLVQQRLVIKPQEASIVRDMFTRFAAQSSVTSLLQELAVEGIRTKRWKTLAGQPKGRRPFDKNALYKVLNNRVYLGEMYFEGEWHASEHEAIVTPNLWAQVHTVMQSRARRTGVSTTPTDEQQFWLKGLLVGSDGRAMTPSLSSIYCGRRYAYYVPQQDIVDPDNSITH